MRIALGEFLSKKDLILFGGFRKIITIEGFNKEDRDIMYGR